MEIIGYLLVIAIALSGAAAARLQNTGQLSGRGAIVSSLVIVLGLLYAVTGLSALFYFSWAHLGWGHLVAFLLAGVFLTGGIGKTESKLVVWTTFVASVTVAAVSEAAILIGHTST